MIGCVLATVGVIGLLKAAHHRRHGCGGWRRAYLHHHRCGGGGGHGDGRGYDGGDEFGPEGPDDEAGSGPVFGRGFGDALGGGFGRGFGRRFILRGVFDRLETTPAQQRVIIAAADEFHQEAARFRSELRKSRVDVAGAFRRSSFDEVVLGELYARHDTAIEGLRKAFVGLGAKVHDALDEKQRSRLADLIESGPRGFGRGFGRAFGPRSGGGFDRHGWDW